MRCALVAVFVFLAAADVSRAVSQQQFSNGWTMSPRDDLTTTLNSGARFCQMVHLGPQDDLVAPLDATIVFICLRQFELRDQIFAITNTNAVTPTLKWTIDITGLESSSVDWIPRHVAGYQESADLLFVAFTVNGDIDGGGANTHSGGLDCAILALSGAAGTVTWAVQFGTSQDDTSFGTVYVPSQDRVYIAGTSAGNMAGGSVPSTEQVFICTFTTAGAQDTCRQDVDPVITGTIRTNIPTLVTTHSWLEVGNMAYNSSVDAIFVTANGCTSFTTNYAGVNLIQRYNLDLTRAWGVAAPLTWYMMTGVLYIDGTLWVSGSSGRARIARFNADTGAHIDTWSDPVTATTTQRRMTRPRFNGTHVVACGMVYEGGLGGYDFKYYVWETDFTGREIVYWGAAAQDRADDIIYVKDSDASKIAFLYTGLTTDVSTLGSTMSSGHVIGKYVIQPGCSAGLYGAENDPCTECAPATFSTSAGFESCSKCQPGTYDSLNSTARTTLCDDCPAGTYQDEFEKLECKACPPGFYTDSAGQTSCKPWYGRDDLYMNVSHIAPSSTGTASSITGLSSECPACAADTFQNATGQTFCYTCPSGTTSTTGSSGCTICDYGYYADGGCQSCPIGTYADIEGAVACKECPFDTSTTASASTSQSVCFCLQGQYGSKTSGRNCKACAEGTDCPLNSEWPLALPGFYVTTDYPDTPLRCVPRASCPGGIGECSEGYEGSACSQCKRGYYRVVQDCAQCIFSTELGTAGVATLSVLVVVTMILGSCCIAWCLLAFFILRQSAVTRMEKGNVAFVSKRGAITSRCKFVAIRTKKCIEVLGIILAVDIVWPVSLLPVKVFSVKASLFDVNVVLPLDCFFTSDEVYLLRTVAFAVSITAGVCLVFIPVVGLAFLMPVSRLAAAQIVGTVLSLASTFYVNLHSLALDRISCFERTSGEYYLNSSPDVRCFTADGQWIYSLPQTVALLVVFSLGIPATILVGVAILHRHPRNKLLRSMFGGFSQKYHSAWYFYEFVIFAEKFLIGMSQVLSVVGSREQIAFLVLVVCFFYLDFLRSKPLLADRDIVFENSFRSCVVVAIMIAFALQCQVSDATLYILTVVFYLALLSVIVLFVLFMLPTKWTDGILQTCRCIPKQARVSSDPPEQEASPFDPPESKVARLGENVVVVATPREDSPIADGKKEYVTSAGSGKPLLTPGGLAVPQSGVESTPGTQAKEQMAPSPPMANVASGAAQVKDAASKESPKPPSMPASNAPPGMVKQNQLPRPTTATPGKPSIAPPLPAPLPKPSPRVAANPRNDPSAAPVRPVPKAPSAPPAPLARPPPPRPAPTAPR